MMDPEATPQITPLMLMRAVSPAIWAETEGLMIDGYPFSLRTHPYQAAILNSTSRVIVCRKGAQIGFTTVALIKTLHGMLSSKYKKGVLYLFPTDRDVSDFSRVRLNPLIKSNPTLAAMCRDTDSIELKQFGESVFYLRGAKSRSRLKSIPVDRIVFDELDEMDSDKVELAKQRTAHSDVKEEVYLSTPTIPDYGIDSLYQKSTQNVWMIKCRRCGTETCLELEFPNCITYDGRRLCKRCGREIDPKIGRWEAQAPNASIEGWWISQLCSEFVDPATILHEFEDPPNGKIGEVYNSRLGLPYIDSKQRLNIQQVFECCCHDPQVLRSRGPCAMGVDVGDTLHVVIGIRIGADSYRVLRILRTPDWRDLHDLARLFNVQCCIVDLRPEVRKVREFQDAENFAVYGCVYHDFRLGRPAWDEDKGVATVGRTEWMDATHNAIIENRIILPRRDDEVQIFAEQMTNTAKVYEENEISGDVRPVYRKLGPDHYYHALGYFMLACERVSAVAWGDVSDLSTTTRLIPKVKLV